MAENHAGAAGRSAAGGNLILVADDEELVRELLARFLTNRGHRVLEAADGRQALKLFRDNQIDLVLSDVRMPGLDGLTLLAAIKEINPRVPVLLISGYGDVETVVKALKAGAENFLPKPLSMDILGKVVDQALSLACASPAGRSRWLALRQNTRLETASRPELICEVVQQIAQSAVAVGYASHDLDNNLKLALVEAVTNAMEHGNRWNQELKVVVEADITPDMLSVSVRDQGQGFDFACLPDPTIGDQLLCERGRGVFLMQAIMDEVCYSAPGNCVTLCKRRQPGVEPGVV
ncbi:MAG: response regulator [Thermodesulfobacteriota bacterium]